MTLVFLLKLLQNNQNKQDKNEACPKGMRLIFLSKFLGIPYAGGMAAFVAAPAKKDIATLQPSTSTLLTQ